MQASEKTIFSEETFWPAFLQDLECARGRVLIQSPFLSIRRLKLLAGMMARLINDGVTICAFVQEPRCWLEDPKVLEPEVRSKLNEIRFSVQTLEEVGVHVTLRKNIHEKLAIVDERIFWEGSLNILSHTITKERMRRWADSAEARQAIAQHALTDCSICVANDQKYSLLSSIRELVLGRKLANVRAELGLSQSELAELTGLAQSRVSQIESGDWNMTLSTLIKLVTGLQLELMLVPRLMVPSITRTLQNADRKG